MKKAANVYKGIVAATIALAGISVSAESLTQYVNPFVGTAGHGHVFLGANVPFGMVQLGPSQQNRGWDWCSGYHYSDSLLVGFSHTHLSGTGVGDLGDILLLPYVGANDSIARFSHADEICRPGYYSVKLGSDILAELTATARSGKHRYSYPADVDSIRLKLDLEYGTEEEGLDRPIKTAIDVIDDYTVSGERQSQGWAKNQHIYYYMKFSKPVVTYNVDNSRTGKRAGFAFVNDKTPLEVNVGISAVSADNARLNLESECADKSFDETAFNADKEWNRQLGKIQVESADDTQKRKFYTALYHTMFAPAIFNDVNGEYRGADCKVHAVTDGTGRYTIFSLWDTYRSLHPLATLIHPELQRSYAETFMDIFDQQGKLPVWHLHGNETDCMVGNPGVIVLADLALKGFVPDMERAYDAMKRSEMRDERSLYALKQYGYIPYDLPDREDSKECVAKGMEYAIADDAAARVAQKMGKTDDYKYFHKRGQSYREYYDEKTGFMRGKSRDGKFRDEDFDPMYAAYDVTDYTEGNAWQYLWLVPQDPNGLIDLLGQKEQFVNRLDSLFTLPSDLGADASPDISGMIGQYAHGNEPGHHTLYLYNYAGRPDKSAPLLRRVMRELYSDSPDGICGNEDVGQMSAWYVLSALGLYQLEPAGGPWVIGAPLFDKATIDLGNGRQLQIVCDDTANEDAYVKEAWLDDKNISDEMKLDFETLSQGGVLKLLTK